MEVRTIVSRLSSPFHNLALETILFKQKPQNQHLLFIYFNKPCIVIGRNQNPWAECNLSTRMPILRRRSGGGAVVHDLQNANFCVQFPRQEFSRTKHLEMIINAFPQLGLKISERNDLLLGTRKVSGSSYKIEKERAYHHATLLLNSELSHFSGVLRPDPAVQGRVLESGGTESVRSPITNTHLAKGEFVNGCIEQFQKLYGRAETVEEADESWLTDEVLQDAEELQSWEWIFGRTPKFQLQLPNDKIVEVIKGRVDGEKLPRDIRNFI